MVNMIWQVFLGLNSPGKPILVSENTSGQFPASYEFLKILNPQNQHFLAFFAETEKNEKVVTAYINY